MSRTNAIGAYSRDGTNDIGAYEKFVVASTRSGSPVSNDIGAYDTQGNDIGAWQDDQIPPTTDSISPIITYYYKFLLGGVRHDV